MTQKLQLRIGPWQSCVTLVRNRLLILYPTCLPVFLVVATLLSEQLVPQDNRNNDTFISINDELKPNLIDFLNSASVLQIIIEMNPN